MNTNFNVNYFVRKKCTPQWKLDNEKLEFMDLTFILSGEAVYISGEKEYKLHGGEAIFLPNQSERKTHTIGMECVAFNFTSENGSLFETPQILEWGNDSELNNLFIEYENAWFTPSEYKELKCKGLFLLIISRLHELKQVQKCSRYSAAIKDYLLAHYKEKVTVKAVADYIGLSPVYCGAVFTKETSETILHYLNRLRVMKAAALLEYGTTRICEAGNEVGFDDLYYFSRIFKSITGLSPEKYKKKKNSLNQPGLTKEAVPL